MSPSSAKWSTVLEVIYENELVIEDLPLENSLESQTLENHDDLRFLSEKTDLGRDEIWLELTFLWEIGLIDRVNRREDEVIGLTEEGFNVAHERELRNQQEIHNRVLAAFTVLVGISALVQAVSVVATQSGPMQWILGFISISGALAFAYVLNGKAEIFTG